MIMAAHAFLQFTAFGSVLALALIGLAAAAPPGAADANPATHDTHPSTPGTTSTQPKTDPAQGVRIDYSCS